MPIYDYRAPCPALRDYVRVYHILACAFPASMRELPVKAYWPRAEMNLTFMPRDPEHVAYGFDGPLVKSPRSRLQGQAVRTTTLHVGRDFMVFNVVFHAGALFRLLGLSAPELTGTFVDAEDVFSADLRRVDEALSYARDHEQMLVLIEEFLLRLVARARRPELLPIDRVSRLLYDHRGQGPMDRLARDACLSQRQFYRRFVQRAGVSPKLYARLARFERAMKVKNARPSLDWLSVALELGYSDYQHLVRDFKEFTSVTPVAFYEASARGPERAYGQRETY